jgi:hypothetical protein
MTSCPLDPESRRRPVSAAVALVLVMIAVLLAAACVSSGFNDQTHPLPKEKFVFLDHQFNNNLVEISGECLWPSTSSSSYVYSFDEKKSVLTPSPHQEIESDNKSLILIYGMGGSTSYREEGNFSRGVGFGGYSWRLVYSLPTQVTGQNSNITIDSINEDGTVAFLYNNTPIILKPKELWENVTRITRSGDGCIEKITTIDSIYNVGILTKK